MGADSVTSTDSRDRWNQLQTSNQPAKPEDPSATRIASVRNADERLAAFVESSPSSQVLIGTAISKPTAATFAAATRDVATARAALAAASTPMDRNAAAQKLHDAQEKWVSQAKARGYAEPSGFNPATASDRDVLKCHAWLANGNVVPREELLHDGGTSYRQNVEATLSLRMPNASRPSFSSFPQPVQKRVLEGELAKMGVKCADGETVATLTKKYDEACRAAQEQGLAKAIENGSDSIAKRQREGRSLSIGLDGRVMSDEELEQYELGEEVKTFTGQSTLGNAMGMGAAIAGGDVEQMRLGAETGNVLSEPIMDIGQHHLMHPHETSVKHGVK